MELALIQNSNSVASVVQSGSWVHFPDGGGVSPAQDGWAGGSFRLEKIQAADEIPSGKQVVSTSVELVDEHPKYVHSLEDIPGPDRVTARQFKMMLSIGGYKAAVETWVATQSELIQIAYADSGTFVRSEPMMEAGFAGLGFTTEQIDDFFIEANKL